MYSAFSNSGCIESSCFIPPGDSAPARDNAFCLAIQQGIDSPHRDWQYLFNAFPHFFNLIDSTEEGSEGWLKDWYVQNNKTDLIHDIHLS